MASKTKVTYVCTECAFETPRWMGKCPSCGTWNTLTETVREAAPKAVSKPSAGQLRDVEAMLSALSDLDIEREIRRGTGLRELDRVLGGGVVDGSVVLLCGDPGIGKSTLLLQVCRTLCQGKSVLYIAGEESPRQIKMRAQRLGVDSDKLFVAPITDMEKVLHAIEHVRPDAVMVDSIQTMNLASLSSSSGSITQVRECTGLLVRIAKSQEIPIFIVGHVNKDGGIAGPKVLEHTVDVVLYFEGERMSSHRILRAVKNRFGSTNEIGVFEMGEEGLEDVENPSLMLLSGRPENVSGTCVACVMEGTRPILAEVQALVSKSALSAPRRMSTGFDFNRAALLIAVLEKRGGYYFGNLDAYVNIVGGLRLEEPAADLPVVMALASNLLDKPIPDNLAAFGEVGLTGELRSVRGAQTRVNECVRLGFEQILLPATSLGQLKQRPEGVKLIGVDNISGAFAVFRG